MDCFSVAPVQPSLAGSQSGLGTALFLREPLAVLGTVSQDLLPRAGPSPLEIVTQVLATWIPEKAGLASEQVPVRLPRHLYITKRSEAC